jgi:hypothetical protein
LLNARLPCRVHDITKLIQIHAKEGAMEFRDAVGILVSASEKRLAELDDLASMAEAESNAEAVHEYTSEKIEIEQAIKVGRRYLGKTPA